MYKKKAPPEGGAELFSQFMPEVLQVALVLPGPGALVLPEPGALGPLVQVVRVPQVQVRAPRVLVPALQEQVRAPRVRGPVPLVQERVPYCLWGLLS